MKNAKLLIIIAASIFLLFTACSGQKSGHRNANTSQTTKSGAAKAKNLSPHALQGKKIAAHNGCMNCHTINGKTLTGPTFKNLYGHKTTLKDGITVVVDSSYIIQSLKHPSAKITAGYSPVMPDYNFLTDHQMEFLVAYLRSLSEVDSSGE